MDRYVSQLKFHFFKLLSGFVSNSRLKGCSNRITSYTMLLLIVCGCCTPAILNSCSNARIVSSVPQILISKYDDAYPAVRPNSTDVAFIRRPGNDPPDSLVVGLFLLDISSTNFQLLVEGLVGKASWLDENSIIFNYFSGDGNGNLFSFDIENNILTKISDNLAYNPSANPLDSTIVYDDYTSIWLLDLITGQNSQIISGGFRTPSWSPSGNMIAVSEKALSGSSRIISTISSSGSILSRVTQPHSNHWHSHPSWSHSGSEIVYEAIYTDDENKSHHDIIAIDTNALSYTTITTGEGPVFSNNDLSIYYSWLSPEDNKGYRIFGIKIVTGTIEQFTF